MSDRIKHVEQARNLLDAAHKATATETSRLNIIEAQVHATLALVEQQRIANLLAFHDISQRQSQLHIGAEERARVQRAGAEIREGLGLA